MNDSMKFGLTLLGEILSIEKATIKALREGGCDQGYIDGYRGACRDISSLVALAISAPATVQTALDEAVPSK